ncbi:MAG: sulfite exporter TauE/SafE family protein [Chitinophagales bacterium]|nr:sulfite exporter TauE/SafE family protein [Bacteroidota bacterium]MCB9044306.1 sulfite exporter TauE/SafE family protein [Chitinophagales bacterium]
MELWTAVVIGLGSSLHCIGMCGPLLMALPQNSSFGYVAKRVLYNLGRITTYALIGLVFGFLGMGLRLVGWQQVFSIAVGVFMLLNVLLSGKMSTFLENNIPFLAHLQRKVSATFSRFIHNDSFYAWGIMGAINGLLPCGMVYIALAGAISTGFVWKSTTYMFFFGLGTFPSMLLMLFAGNWLRGKFSHSFRWSLQIITIVVAVLFILRGLNLGIPLISPHFDTSAGAVKHSCH